MIASLSPCNQKTNTHTHTHTNKNKKHTYSFQPMDPLVELIGSLPSRGQGQTGILGKLDRKCRADPLVAFLTGFCVVSLWPKRSEVFPEKTQLGDVCVIGGWKPLQGEKRETKRERPIVGVPPIFTTCPYGKQSLHGSQPARTLSLSTLKGLIRVVERLNTNRPTQGWQHQS